MKRVEIIYGGASNEKEIYDIKDLVSSTKNDITFFHSKKYKDAANLTKASFCITE